MAMSRAVLAAVFLLALWLDPTQPARAAALGYGLLVVYLVWTIVLVTVAWRSWWYDVRLAAIVHAIDVLVFVAAVFVTETETGDFSSPFMAFTTFLLINASMRWGWYGAVGTAAALFTLNAGSALLVNAEGFDLEPYRFGRRQTYMLALSVMMVWLSSERRVSSAITLPAQDGPDDDTLATAARFARETFQAPHVAIRLVRDDEPWTELVRIDNTGITREQLGPAADAAEPITPDDWPAQGAMLFDTRRFRRMRLGPGDRIELARVRQNLPLARACGVEHGMIAGFTTDAGHGEILLWGMRDACADDLPVLASLASAAGVARDRADMAVMARSQAVSAVRQALARDLHDSVAQFLAGTLFRLEALRHKVRDGGDPDPQIVAMKSALRTEQIQLRAMVDRLRRGVDGDRATDLVGELRVLLAEVGGHWHLATRFDTPVESLDVPIGIAYEARQLVREAVANAARHGQSRKVELTLQQCTGVATECVRLTIGDDGIGFPAGQPDRRPRSIAERVAALGGALAIEPRDPGTALVIDLPLRLPA